MLSARSLVMLLVDWRDRMGRRVRSGMLLRMRSLGMLLLLMGDARGSRVLQVLRLNWTLLLLMGVVLHREKTH